ncbi:hypothetical protein OS493_038247, partial [Desmophyllum pertusum]
KASPTSTSTWIIGNAHDARLKGSGEETKVNHQPMVTKSKNIANSLDVPSGAEGEETNPITSNKRGARQ